MDRLKTYTLTEISDILDKPRSTVREWKDDFEPYLPVIGHGRNMRYKEEALEIFRIIADMKADGASREIIEGVLRDTSTEIMVYEHEEAKNPIAELVRAYDEIAKGLAEQNEQWRQRFEALNQEMAKLSAENERLHNVVEQQNTEQRQLMAEHGETLVAATREVIDERVQEVTAAIDQQRQRDDERSQEISRQIRELLEAKRKKRWWQRG